MSRTVFLVGGNSGIGLATAKLLRNQGDHVFAASRSSDQLVPLGIEVQSFDAEESTELTVPDSLDGLVYFPGSINLKPFHRLTDEDFLRDLQVNLMGAVRSIRSALPSLKASGSASVVLFSTIAADQGMPFHASIAAAKSAVEGLAKSLAAEFAPKIRVNVIAPSFTDTPLAAPLLNNDAKKEAAGKRHPLNQVGDPDEVAKLVAFLLCEDSGFLTG